MRYRCQNENCGKQIITTGFPGTCDRCGSILSVTYDNIGTHKTFRQLKEEEFNQQFSQLMSEIDDFLANK